jgi:hypothetical protein
VHVGQRGERGGRVRGEHGVERRRRHVAVPAVGVPLARVLQQPPQPIRALQREHRRLQRARRGVLRESGTTTTEPGADVLTRSQSLQTSDLERTAP